MKYECKISTTLPELLSRNNITMVAMSEKTGIKYGRLVSWKHKNSPRVGWELMIAAEFFKVSLSYLLYGVKENLDFKGNLYA